MPIRELTNVTFVAVNESYMSNNYLGGPYDEVQGIKGRTKAHHARDSYDQLAHCIVVSRNRIPHVSANIILYYIVCTIGFM